MRGTDSQSVFRGFDSGSIPTVDVMQRVAGRQLRGVGQFLGKLACQGTTWKRGYS